MVEGVLCKRDILSVKVEKKEEFPGNTAYHTEC